LKAADGMFFELSVLFDTGADVSLFSPSVARLLGVDIRHGTRGFLSGLGGDLEVFIHRIPIWIGDDSRRIRVAFATREVPNILGRLDMLKDASWSFFDERYFAFRYGQKTV